MVVPSASMIAGVDLSSAIARFPLTLATTASVIDAIHLMQMGQSVCDRFPQSESSLSAKRHPQDAGVQSCVLAMEGDRLAGILTERDLIRLEASGKIASTLSVAGVMSTPVVTLRQSEFTDIFVPLALFQQHQIRHLPMVDDGGSVVGLLTEASLQQLLQGFDPFHQITAAEIMTATVVQVAPTATLAVVIQQMAVHSTSAVVVMDGVGETSCPLGILSEHDVVQLLALGVDIETVQVADVMEQPIVAVQPTASLLTVQQLMQAQRTSQVMVLQEDGCLLGLVTQANLLSQMNPRLIYRMAGQLAQAHATQLQTQKVREQSLMRIATQIRASLDLQDILAAAVQEVRQLLQCDRLLVYQFRPDWSGVVRAESVGTGWASCLGDRPVDPCFQENAAQRYASGYLLAVNDVATAGYPDCYLKLLEPYQVKALLAVPILVGGSLWGLLIGHQCSNARPWQPGDLALLDEISVQLAIAIQQATTHNALQSELAERQRAEASLRASEERYRQIVETTLEGVWIIGSDNCTTYVNPRMAEMLGYTANEMIGQPLVAFLDDEGSALATRNLERRRQGIQEHHDFCFKHKDGKEIWTLLATNPLYDEDGNYVGALAMVTDISDRKQAEQERFQNAQIRQELTILEAMLDHILAGYWDADLVNNTQYISPGFKRMFGYADHELPNSPETWKQLVFPEDLPKAAAAYQQHVESHGQVPYQVELRYRHKDGSPVWIVCSGQVIQWDDMGNPLRLIGCHIDITERKRAEAALIKSGQRYQALMNNASDAIILADPQGNILEVNHKAEVLLGYSQAELTCLQIMDLHPPEVLKAVERHFGSIVAGHNELPFETLVVQNNGDQIPVSITAASIHLDGEHIIQGSFRDIRARKQAEEENQRLKERLQFMLSSSPAVIFICKPNGDYRATFISDNIVDVTGHTADDFLSSSSFWADHVHPDDVSNVFTNLPSLYQQENYVHEYRFQHREGHYLWMRAELRLVRDAMGNPAEIVGYLADISDRKQAELALQASETRFRRVFESNVVGMVFASFRGRIINANDRFLEMVGYTREDLYAGTINWAAMTPPEYASADEAAIERLQKYGVIEPWEKEYFRKDGTRIPILLGAAVLPGTEDQTLCVVVDNSRPKQAEWRLQWQADREHLLNVIAQRIRTTLNLQTVLDTAVTELHQVLQSDRVLVYQVLPNGTGKAIAESVSPGWPVILDRIFPEEIFPRDNYERYVQGRIFALTDRETGDVLECLAGFLEEIQVRAKLVVPIVQNGTLWGLVIAHQCDRPREWQPWEIDLLGQLSGQLAIAIQQSELYTQLQDSHLQLTHINAELMRATRLKDEFLANMSHELRTPLNAILGMSESLLEEVLGPINDHQKRAITTVEQSGQHLLGLINDILELSKIEAGKLELDLSTASVHHLCHSSLSFVKQQAFKKHLQLQVVLAADLGEIEVDERRIRQVLINLLTNAVKFTPAGGRVTLEVHREPADINLSERVSLIHPAHPIEAEGNHACQLGDLYYLCISVMDTGIGISPEDQAKLFQPFVQVDSSLNRKYEGTGLGLALVKRIVELHGGSVSLHSQLGEGSCFTVCLPYFCRSDTFLPPQIIRPELSKSGAEVVSEAGIAAASEGPTIRILLAEDNEANIVTVSSYLQAKGYQVTVANNGEEAIALAITQRPDLILMDIQMPGMDGLEAMKQIRQTAEIAEMPIIALTALAMEGDRERCLAAGADDYLAKPVKLKELAKTVRHILHTDD